MSKRVADKQLDHFNWNDEEEPEEAGVYKAASEDVLKQRVIKTAKRRIASRNENEGENKSAFSGFGGFVSSSNSSTSAKMKSTFSFLNNTSSNGTSKNSPTTLSFNSTSSLGATKKEEASLSSELSVTSTVKTNEDNEYLTKLTALNEGFIDWIKMHVARNPACILTPIFQDYEKYLKEIETLKASSKSNPESKPPESTPGFTFSDSVSSPFSFKPSSSSDTLNSFLMNKTHDSPPKDQKPLPSPFTSTLPNTGSSFKFGSIQSNPSSGAMFGSPSQFSFGKPPDSQKEKEDGEDEDEEPPKVEFTPVVEEDARYTQRLKVYLKKGDKYNDCGVGTLYLKEVEGKFQAIVRADTSLGNLILNIVVTKDLPCKRLGKNNVMLICHPLPPVPDPKTKNIPPPEPVLLKVKTDEEADKLLAEFEKCKK